MGTRRTAWAYAGLAAVFTLSSLWGFGSGKVYAQEGTGWQSARMTSGLEASKSIHILPDEVLVKYKKSQFQAKEFRSAAYTGGSSYTKVKVDEGKSVNEALAELAKDPSVEYAEPVYVFSLMNPADTAPPEAPTDPGGSSAPAPDAPASVPSLVPLPGGSSNGGGVPFPNDARFGEQWGASVTDMVYGLIRVPVEKRSSVTIAVVDSGVTPSGLDLPSSQILEGYDAYNNINGGYDVYGHGTLVAGIAAAVANNGEGIAGVAGSAKILPIRVGEVQTVNNQSTFYIPSDALARGIWKAIEKKANVINLSLGIAGFTEDSAPRVVKEAIQAALRENIVVVAAAGNESNHWLAGEDGNSRSGSWEDRRSPRGFETTIFPANMSGVISVGAVTQLPAGKLGIADFSNVGKITAVAPGTHILSTTRNGSYEADDGTSFSTPMVAGQAALLVAQNPRLTPADVSRIIYGSSVKSPELVMPDYELKDVSREQLYEAFFGGGLINIGNSLKLPRLKLEAEQQLNGSVNRTYKLKVSAFDDTGAPANVSGPIRIWKNTAAQIDPAPTVTELTYGKAEVSIDISGPNDAFYTSFYADEAGDTNKYVLSNTSEFIVRPAQPSSSLTAGEYKGTQSVTLTTSTPDAEIYYTTNGADPTSRSNSTKYTGAIPVSESQTIKAVAVKNEVASPVSSFAYTITSGGGFIGGGGFMPPTTTEAGVKENVLSVKPDKDKLLEQLNAGKSKSVTIDATSGRTVNRVEVEVPGEVWSKASSAEASIVIKADQATLTMPARAITLSSATEAVQVSASLSGETADKPAYATLASSVFDLQVKAGERTITSFDEPIAVEFKYDAAKIADPDKTAVFYYNETERRWEYVGGEKAQGTVKVGLRHFSRYAVMEWNRTFADIQGHWAQAAIERMAARQIADGMTESDFAPEAVLTRAQFAALLTRSLRIPAGTSELPFRDVPQEAWYRDAVSRALAARLISGVSDTEFAPEQPITREQMAVMLMNAYAYASKAAGSAQPAVTAPASFKDGAAISGWAQEAVQEAYARGLLEGNPDGTFGPRSQATRAQAITVLNRLLDRLDK